MELMQYLRSHNYGVTSVDGEGGTGRVKMVFTIIRRQDLTHVVGIIKQFHPTAFYSVEEVKSVAEGVFPAKPSRGVFSWIDSLRFLPEREIICFSAFRASNLLVQLNIYPVVPPSLSGNI